MSEYGEYEAHETTHGIVYYNMKGAHAFGKMYALHFGQESR